GDALDVARALGGRAVDEEGATAADGEPDGVVVVDVAEVVEVDAQVALGDVPHGGAELDVAADARLVDDEAGPDAGELGLGQVGEGRVDALERLDDREGSGQRRQLVEGPLDAAQLEAVAEEGAAEPADEEGAQEAVRRFDGGRLGDGHAEAGVGGDEEVEGGVGGTGAEIEEDVVRAELAELDEHARLAGGAKEGGGGGVVEGREQAQARDGGRDGPDRVVFDLLARGGGRDLQAYEGVQVRTCRVHVGDDHGAPELREVDAEVDG